jgi:predicted nucleic acid-binding protein
MSGEADVAGGALTVHVIEGGDLGSAVILITELRKQPLRTLDAIHLAIVRRLSLGPVATADRVMGAACKELGIDTATFF